MPRRAPTRATLAQLALAAIEPTTVLLAVLLAATLASPRARANVVVQGIGTAAAGWTDNILIAPDQPVANGPPRESAFFFQLSPGVALSTLAPRLLQRLAYTFTADLFVPHSEANSYSNTLDWVANVRTSPTTSLNLVLQSQQGKISSFNLNQESSNATVGALPQNSNVNYFSQSVTESFEATPQQHWRVTQRLILRAFVPFDQSSTPTSYSVAGEVGFDRTFRVDAIGPVLRVEFVDFVQPRDPTTDVAIGFDQRQVVTTLTARWRRDWSPFWNTEADLGLTSVAGLSADPASSTVSSWAPSALAAVRWLREFGSAELRYAHYVAPNAFAGALFSTDEVALQGRVPIARARMYFGATVAYDHTQRLSSVAGVPDVAADVAFVDATVGWQPLRELTVFARYSLLDQFGSPPVNGVPALLPDLTRNTVLVGASVIFPVAAAAVRVPSAQQGSRVDHDQQSSLPELHAQPQ